MVSLFIFKNTLRKNKTAFKKGNLLPGKIKRDCGKLKLEVS